MIVYNNKIFSTYKLFIYKIKKMLLAVCETSASVNSNKCFKPFTIFNKLFLITVFLQIFGFSQSCGFNSHKHKEPYRLEDQEDHKRFLQPQEFQPLRIYFDYTTLDAQTNITEATKNGIRQILNATQNVFQNILKVQRLPYKLQILQCDPTVSISQTVSTTGADADLVIFPFIDYSLTDNIEAYASACVISLSNKKPVAGLIAFSPQTNTTKTNWLQYYSTLAIHELTHVLVFNPPLFDSYVDANNNPLGIDNVLKQEVVNNVTRTMIKTPKVVEAAKKHFNCSKVTGVELEDYGGDGTAGSHWEARVMMGDYMIGVSMDEVAISDITLALFEDSGWYQANYYTGGLFRFGKNAGCGFLNSTCLTDKIPNYPNEFCNAAYSSICSAGKTTRAICYIANYNTTLDLPFRYFSDPKEGGFPYADYCPVAAVVTNSSYYYPSSCTAGYNQYSSLFEESISDSSACFSSSLLSTNFTLIRGQGKRATCYNYKCAANNTLIVTIGNSTINCTQTNAYMTIPGYNGHLKCPDYNLICTTTTPCNNLIECAAKRSIALDSSYAYINPNIKTITNGTDNSTVLSIGTISSNNITFNNTLPSDSNITDSNHQPGVPDSSAVQPSVIKDANTTTAIPNTIISNSTVGHPPFVPNVFSSLLTGGDNNITIVTFTGNVQQSNQKHIDSSVYLISILLVLSLF